MPTLFETNLSLGELTPVRFEYELSFNLGHAALWSGDFDQAVAAFTGALNADSRCLDVHYNLGVLRLLRNEPKVAREHFAAAAALAVRSGLPYDVIGVTTDDTPVSDALQAAAWRSVRLPAYLGLARHLEHFLPAMIRKVTQLRRTGAADAAVGIRDLMVAYAVQHPDVAVEVMIAVADALCQLGWSVEAEAVCRRAIMTGSRRAEFEAADDRWLRFFFILGQSLALQKRLEESLEAFQRSMAILPVPSTYSIIFVLLALHRPQAALLVYDGADPAFHTAALARSFLGMIYHCLGRWSEAEEQHREAVALSQGEAGQDGVGRIFSQWGLTVLRQGRMDEALALLRQGAALERDYNTIGSLQVGLARCGLKTEAAAVGRDLADTWPWALPFLTAVLAGFGFDTIEP